MTLLPLPAFSDNYIWFLHDGHHALVVDPGDAQPVLDALARLKLTLQTILVTHHHADHVGGVDTLRETTGAKVYGPAFETIPEPVERLVGGDTVQALGYTFKVSDVPGHTSGHIAYFCDDVTLDGHSAPLLFCGDTLFSGGCGRLFEGTPGQMLASLTSFAVLPGNTRVCATHEYTLSNLRFARAVEPGNADLVQYETACVARRAAQQPTLPSTVAQELLINPFLRSHVPAVIQAALTFAPTTPQDDPVAVFAAVREWKNQFK
jgi:hydroxyacylglutathione hydrolase